MKSLQWPEFIWPISPMWLYSQSPQGTEYTTPGNFSFDNSIGETGNFKRRIKQHDYDVGKRHMASNALAEHADSSGHEINWGAARILAKEKNLTSLLPPGIIDHTDNGANIESNAGQSASSLLPLPTSHS